MNYSEMTPRQIGWFISDTCDLEKLGVFVESRLNTLAELERKCVQQAERIKAMEEYCPEFVLAGLPANGE